MDLTQLFHASVKTARIRSKALGLEGDYSRNILPREKKICEFSKRAKGLITNISKLSDFLANYKTEFLSMSSQLVTDSSSYHDHKFDHVVAETQKLMINCSNSITLLRSEVNQNKLDAQNSMHRQNVLALVEKYFKDVSKNFNDLKNTRTQRLGDKKKLGRLGVDSQRNTEHIAQLKTDFESLHPDEDSDEELNDAERIQLMEENKRIFEEMGSMVDEIRRVEESVVEISKLQNLFAEKTLEQSKQIENISDKMVDTTENIKEGNEEIREAIKNNAGFRVWILLFLMMCSLSLILLDWFS
ncbi:Syntaxin-18 [Trichoplax sp. H2]|nr:Syntaxin-18 [Trichoplax sp. H2]|eukprot:RDD43547.1 Syntaxin-18 [Trichoplax sp. H2]